MQLLAHPKGSVERCSKDSGFHGTLQAGNTSTACELVSLVAPGTEVHFGWLDAVVNNAGYALEGENAMTPETKHGKTWR